MSSDHDVRVLVIEGPTVHDVTLPACTPAAARDVAGWVLDGLLRPGVPGQLAGRLDLPAARPGPGRPRMVWRILTGRCPWCGRW